MSFQDFHLTHDWRVEFSGEKQAFYLFDAENKIIAIFPREKRNSEFFREYVKLCVTNMQVAFLYGGKFKRFYQKMAGLLRKRMIWNQVEKDF